MKTTRIATFILLLLLLVACGAPKDAQQTASTQAASTIPATVQRAKSTPLPTKTSTPVTAQAPTPPTATRASTGLSTTSDSQHRDTGPEKMSLAEKLVGVWAPADPEITADENWPALILLPNGTMVKDLSFFSRYEVIEEQMAFAVVDDEGGAFRAQILELTEDTLKIVEIYGPNTSYTYSYRKTVPANVSLADISGLWRGARESQVHMESQQYDVWWLLNDEYGLALRQAGIPEGVSPEEYDFEELGLPFAVIQAEIPGVFCLSAPDTVNSRCLVVREYTGNEAQFLSELEWISVERILEDIGLANQLEGAWDDIVFGKDGTLTGLDDRRRGHFRAFESGKLEVLLMDEVGHFDLDNDDYVLFEVDFPDRNSMRLHWYGINEEILRRTE